MKLATTIGEMYAFTKTPADVVRQYEGSGFRCLDHSFYSIVKKPDHPFMQDDRKTQILDACGVYEA